MAEKTKNWKKIVRNISLGLLAFFLITWIGLYAYVSANKKSIITKIEQAVSNKIEGKLVIKDIKPDFFKSFPLMSFRLERVSLQDSLYAQHGKKLLDIEDVFVRLNLFSIFKGSPSFSKILIENGQMNLFVGPDGYSNSYLLKSKDTTTSSAPTDPGLNISNFEINNFKLSIDNQLLNKKFGFTAKELQGSYHRLGDGAKLKMDAHFDFEQLGFNLKFGSFLKGSTIKGFFDIDFNKASQTFIVHKTPLSIDGEKVFYEAKIELDKSRSVPFQMSFDAPDLDFKKASKWMSENIYAKLSKLSFATPINLQCEMHGGFTERGQNPNIKLKFDTEKNKVEVLGYTFDQVNFAGHFNNEIFLVGGRHDSNTVIALDTLSATFMNFPVVGRHISIANLKKPFAKAELGSKFDPKVLNNIFGEVFSLNSGTGEYQLRYNGELFSNTLIADNIYGKVNIDNMDFVYKERNLKFNKASLNLRFEGKDLWLDKFKLNSNNSDLAISGYSTDFLTAFMQLPGKAQMNLKLVSNNIDLGAFSTYFVQKRKVKASNKSSTNAVKNASNKLDDFLSNSSIALAMNVKHAIYKRFEISDLNAQMKFTEAGINIDHLQLRHADGSLQLKAGINQSAPNNPFFATVNLNQVRVEKFFHAMNNFGFKDLTEKNLAGLISIDGQLKGKITDLGTLLENSLDGEIQYTLHNAALKNYSLFDKVKKFFKNRKLDHIEIPHFVGKINFNNGTITIPQTDLATSAINLSFIGKYGISKNRPTHIDLKVPLRNPQVDKRREDQGRSKRKGEGIVLHFNAKSDATGKINIGVGKTEEKKALDLQAAADSSDTEE